MTHRLHFDLCTKDNAAVILNNCGFGNCKTKPPGSRLHVQGGPEKVSRIVILKPVNDVRVFINFGYKMSTICDVISCCVRSFYMGKINVGLCDKIVKRKENMEIEEIFLHNLHLTDGLRLEFTA